MSNYRESPLDESAVGTVERIERWGGQTYGGRVPSFLALAQGTGGVYLEADRPMTIEEGIASLPDLNFTVKVEEGLNVQLRTPKGTMGKRLPMPKYRATVLHYEDGRDPVAVAPVGTRYEPIQVPDALAFGDEFVREGGGWLAALGVYGDPLGSRVYAAFDLGDMTVGGKDQGDEHRLFATATTSNDGSSGLSLRIVPLRLRCTNEGPGYFGRRATRYTIRHMRGAKGNIIVAREALGIAFAVRDNYVEEAEKLLKIPVTPDRFRIYAREVFGMPSPNDEKATARALSFATAKEDELLAVLASETNEFGRGTAYAAFQAVVEDVDWVARVNGADSPEVANLRRANRTMNGQTDAVKARAWDMAMALV